LKTKIKVSKIIIKFRKGFRWLLHVTKGYWPQPVLEKIHNKREPETLLQRRKEKRKKKSNIRNKKHHKRSERN